MPNQCMPAATSAGRPTPPPRGPPPSLTPDFRKIDDSCSDWPREAYVTLGDENYLHGLKALAGSLAAVGSSRALVVITSSTSQGLVALCKWTCNRVTVYHVPPIHNGNHSVHAKPGSAEVLMIRMYQIFTGNQIKTLRGEYSLDFT